MKSQLVQNEYIITKNLTELHNGVNTVSGIIYLTNKQIIFEAHNVKINNGIINFQYSDILTIEKSWTKFMGIIPITFDSITIKLKNSNQFSFVLQQRNLIFNEIEKIRKK